MSAIDYEKESASRSNWLDITGGTEVTLLDYFAGKALVGLLTGDAIIKEADTGAEWLQKTAACAYEAAEAMLKERDKRFTPQGTVRGITGKTYG